MRKDLAEKLIEILDEVGEEGKLSEDYSGRGMYGKTTCGVTTNLSPAELINVIIQCADLLVENDQSLFPYPNIHSDSMGLSFIYY